MNYKYYINATTSVVYRWDKISLQKYVDHNWMDATFYENDTNASAYYPAVLKFISLCTELSYDEAVLELL